MRAAADFPRPMGATPEAVYLASGAATVADDRDDVPDIQPILNAENLAVHTGVRTSTWEHKRKAAALLFAFLAEYECDVGRTAGGGVRIGCPAPTGLGYLIATGDTLEDATLALWQKRAKLGPRAGGAA
ncbi:MAG: hypothetical protein ACK6DK_09805 [Gemmatimonadota bacterium]